jgi:16S rRNA (adenine1518-N6/adenine1519-N6)-dimethyltransferase
VIELDRDLAAGCAATPADVIEADVLKVDFGALADAAWQPLRVVGNLPYNISTPILFHLLPLGRGCVDQHFMLQKEVVERMAARPAARTTAACR